MTVNLEDYFRTTFEDELLVYVWRMDVVHDLLVTRLCRGQGPGAGPWPGVYHFFYMFYLNSQKIGPTPVSVPVVGLFMEILLAVITNTVKSRRN